MSQFDMRAIYASICDALPKRLHAVAGELSYRMKLGPYPDEMWSAFFCNEITLQAPALFREALPQAPEAAVSSAVTAHSLAVIGAFGACCLEDPQARITDIQELLRELVAMRDRALVDTCASTLPETEVHARWQLSECLRGEALHSERAWLGAASGASFATYTRLALTKQSLRFPATLLLAQSVGLDEHETARIDATLGCVWLALQVEADVLDWEACWRKGSSWALALTRSLGPQSFPLDRDSVRSAVHGSGVLAMMLELAQRQYRVAARRASLLGAWRLASWARQREMKTAELLVQERASADHARRLQKTGSLPRDPRRREAASRL